MSSVPVSSGGPPVRRLIWAIVLAGIVIAIAGSALFLLRSRQGASLDGVWIARMQRPGQRPFNIRIALQISGMNVTGQVTYPTGQGIIQQGTFQAGLLTFFTRYVPQGDSEPATTTFRGTVRGREIDLTATNADGSQLRGTARKTE